MTRAFDLDIPADPPRTWAESASVSGYLWDGSRSVGMRIARFPVRGEATLSGHAFTGGRRFHGLSGAITAPGAFGLTDVSAPRVRYDLRPDAEGFIERTLLPDGRFRGVARSRLMAHEGDHAPPGPGEYAITIEATFLARHAPQFVRPGRMEVAGELDATVTTPHESFRLAVRGKWHEQIGDRPRFGPPFTYVSIASDDVYLMVGRNPSTVYGFSERDGAAVLAREFTIDPPAPRRAFRVVLVDGRVIEGVAEVQREHSSPIEGKRRPGTFVFADTNVGRLSGNINDWQPDP